MQPQNVSYTKSTHFRSMLRDMEFPENAKVCQRKVQSDVLKALSREFRDQNEMTVAQVHQWLLHNSNQPSAHYYAQKHAKTYCSALKGPWHRVTRYYDKARLVLLAGRFDHQSWFGQITYDVVKIIAMMVPECRRERLPVTQFTPQQEQQLTGQFEAFNTVFDELHPPPRKQTTSEHFSDMLRQKDYQAPIRFPPFRFIATRLCDLNDIFVAQFDRDDRGDRGYNKIWHEVCERLGWDHLPDHITEDEEGEP